MMCKRILSLLLLSLLLVLVTGCSSSHKLSLSQAGEKQKDASIQSQPKPKKVVVGIDRTGSFFPNISSGIALRALQSFFKSHVHPGDHWFFRFIQTNSYDASAQIPGLEHIVLPSQPALQNPFDVVGRTKAATARNQMDAVISDVGKKVDSLRKVSPVVGTDIYGFFKKAEDILRDSDENWEKWIVVFTDLEDTIETETSFELKGVKVIIFHSGKKLHFSERVKRNWQTCLEDAGAQVEIRDLSEAFLSNTPEEEGTNSEGGLQ